MRIKDNNRSEQDFNIVNNRFLLQHDQRENQIKQNNLIKAAEEYWKKNSFDPINQTFTNTEAEKLILEKEQDKIKNHATEFYKRMPVAM